MRMVGAKAVPPGGSDRTPVAGIVLAAGRSSRMGRDKALLQAGGVPLVALLSRAMWLGGCRPVVVVASERNDRIVREVLDEPFSVVTNRDEGSEPIDSLRLAIGSLPARCGGVVFSPVDLGWCMPATVAAVRLALDIYPAAVARLGGRPGHPAAVRKELFGRLMGPEADSGARHLFGKLEKEGLVRHVDTADPCVLHNFNRPDQVARLECVAPPEELLRPVLVASLLM